MRIALGADHRGFGLKQRLERLLVRDGHRVIDLGPDRAERVDYPDFARAVAQAVASGRAHRGILICSTGIGMSIAANRVRGVRAALCHDLRTARMSREHNDANVLCLGADVVTAALATRMVRLWLGTPFAGGRHRRRLVKIEDAGRG